MLTGRVVQFDESRGYGFIAPDGGGEDVFVHVNMLGSDRWSLAPGVPVEFQAAESERGPKAQTVRVIGNRATTVASSQGNGTASTGGSEGGTAAGPAAPAAAAASASGQEDDDGLCDILSERALRIEITEALLNSMPDLTVAQVVAVRGEVLALARRHGWVEEDT